MKEELKGGAIEINVHGSASDDDSVSNMRRDEDSSRHVSFFLFGTPTLTCHLSHLSLSVLSHVQAGISMATWQPATALQTTSQALCMLMDAPVLTIGAAWMAEEMAQAPIPVSTVARQDAQRSAQESEQAEGGRPPVFSADELRAMRY